MNQQDPYSGILLEMQDQAVNVQPLGWCLGRVTAIGPGRLIIQANGMTLDEQDLRVNPMLLYDEQETVKITFADKTNKITLGVNDNVTAWPPCSDHKLQIMYYDIPGLLSGTVEATITTRRLKVGDQVVLLPDAEGEIYYVLCKVVGL